jgi:hypothetical protein
MRTMPASPAALAVQPFLEAMQQAGKASGADKISVHRYDHVYGRALAAYANVESFAMVEIGYGAGEGVVFWHTLFPRVFLYCLDLNHGHWSDEKTCVLRVDQSKPHDLERALATVRRPISLIVDDGSHHPDHQLLSFSTLFLHLLQPGGLYILEDVETSYWRRGSLYDYEFSYGLGNRHSTIEAFKLVADYVNRRFLDPADQNWLVASLLDVGIDPAAAAQVESVSFGRNAILLNKTLATECESDLMSYLHLHCTSRGPRPVSHTPTDVKPIA